MTVLDLTYYPDEILDRVLDPIDLSNISSEIKQLASDMIETSHENQGIGLAANQVGRNFRMFVMDVRGDNLANETEREWCDAYLTTEPMIFINPEIIWSSEEMEDSMEGCLSLPDQQIIVTRPRTIEMKYHDLNGTEHRIKCAGIFGRCSQHEIDHINGITLVHKATGIKAEIMREKAEKIRAKKLKQRTAHA